MSLLLLCMEWQGRHLLIIHLEYIEQTQMNTAQPLSSRSFTGAEEKRKEALGEGVFFQPVHRGNDGQKSGISECKAERGRRIHLPESAKLFNMPGSLSLLILQNQSCHGALLFYGTNEETKAQRGPVTYPRSHSFIWQKSHLNQACWTAITSYNNH